MPATLQAAISKLAGGYSQQAELSGSGGLGFSVALSAGGSTALIGAEGRDSDAGAAYVFTRRGGVWSQAAELTAADAASDSFFGRSVAISASGGTALVGAIGSNSGAGAGYVFTLRRGTWSQIAELTPSDPASDNQFGGSVALSSSGGTAMVGAFGHDLGAGAAYVFTRGGGA